MVYQPLRNYKPHAVYLLWGLIAFQALTGIAGGLIMVMDPSGATLQIPGIFLMGTPFSDYLVPGLFLLLLLGLFPGLGLLGLLGLNWQWPNAINIYKRMHWGGTYTLYSAIVLIIWMDVQVYFIGYWHLVQTFNALLGVIILIITLLPQVVDFYRKQENIGV